MVRNTNQNATAVRTNDLSAVRPGDLLRMVPERGSTVEGTVVAVYQNSTGTPFAVVQKSDRRTHTTTLKTSSVSGEVREHGPATVRLRKSEEVEVVPAGGNDDYEDRTREFLTRADLDVYPVEEDEDEHADILEQRRQLAAYAAVELMDDEEEPEVRTDGGEDDDEDDYELRGTYDRHAYDAIRDGFEDGDRVTLVYESPYSGTEVEVEGTARDVFAVSFTLDLDDGREWGVMGESVRTTKNSRRASGRVDAKNGRTVGGVRELRVYAVEDEDADSNEDSEEEAAEVRADGGEVVEDEDDDEEETVGTKEATDGGLSEGDRATLRYDSATGGVVSREVEVVQLGIYETGATTALVVEDADGDRYHVHSGGRVEAVDDASTRRLTTRVPREVPTEFVVEDEEVQTDGGQDLDEHPDRRLADSATLCGEPTLVGGDLVECEKPPGHAGDHAGHVPDEGTAWLLWDLYEWTDPDSEDEDTETSGTPIRTDGGEVEDEDRYDKTAVVRAINLPVGSDGAGFSVGRDDGEPDGTLTGSVGHAVAISQYVDDALEAVRACGVDEEQYSDLPETPRRREEREEGVTYRVEVARVHIDEDADEDDPDRLHVELTDAARERLRDAHSVRCPECGEQGFDGQGYAVVEGTRMYLRRCWECGTRFAVEDEAEFRPDGGTVEDDEEEDPTPNTLRVSRTELADGTVRGELAASKTVQGATVSVEATGDMDHVERATKEWLQVVAAVEETLSDDPSGPESFGLFFDDSTEEGV